ncbi:hypothetical protein BHECKSOX2_1355 [Bathymodiolus heckerae thiotrophic gill symbiont]|nr:hypothetical protein [Bathymodiolus heckerae thiotrophic gill symbiont]SMN14083.1 hypothetical protein BHECKSOX2_1355 [Bathymodiolus heckerae thiotrophic gill symbiont]
MKKIIKLGVLAFFVISIAACGRIGKLEQVKSSSLTIPSVIYTV